MQGAILVTEVGKPLLLGERGIPEPPKDCIRVRVEYAGLLPHDTYGRDRGLFIGDKLPYVLGTNIVGIVDKLGEEVGTFETGQRVFGQGDPVYFMPDFAGLQEYALLDADAATVVTGGLSAEGLATLPVNATTSFEALFHPNGFNFPAPLPDVQRTEGQPDPSTSTLVVIGGGTSCGKLAVQFARMVSMENIIAVASLQNEEQLKRLGATHVIDRHLGQTAIAEAVRKVVPSGTTYIYDCASWEFSLARAIVSEDQPSVILTLHRIREESDLAAIRNLQKCELRFIIGQNAYLKPLLRPFWKQLGQWVAEGKLAVPECHLVEGLDAKAIDQALDDYQGGRLNKPVVVKVK